MKNFLAFIFGGLFSIGLILSWMSNPEKVLNFLDLFGHWDASLAFVMIGAIMVAIIPFKKLYEVKHLKQYLMNQLNYRVIIKLILN